MLNFNNLWIEKYRPHSIGELCLDADVKNLITGYAAQKEIPNLLLVGRPGIGKTSLARIIINDLLKCQYLYINASDENGIDTVRHKITNFAQTKSLDGGIKIIVLDEADGLTEVGQRALRNTMEEYAKFTRFILTANQLHRIIPALQSRCQSIQVESSLLDVVMRCMHILKQAILSSTTMMTSNLQRNCFKTSWAKAIATASENSSSTTRNHLEMITMLCLKIC
jgi:replication factor C small subunit